jgi:hypothetical protein
VSLQYCSIAFAHSQYKYEDPEERKSFSRHTIFFTTFCIWLAEISAVLVLDDLLNMSFETYMGLTRFPHANAKTLGVEPIY